MDFDLPEALALLSPQRREAAMKYKFEMGQRTCAAAYLLLCRGLQQEYGITEPPLFEFGAHGKPTLVGHPDIHFNLSHCREAAICFVGSKPVGVDVETIRPLKESLMNYTMSEHEVASIRSAADPALEFTRLWTRKESLLKLTGEGINNHLQQVLERSDVEWETVVSADRRYVYSICHFL